MDALLTNHSIVELCSVSPYSECAIAIAVSGSKKYLYARQTEAEPFAQVTELAEQDYGSPFLWSNCDKIATLFSAEAGWSSVLAIDLKTGQRIRQSFADPIYGLDWNDNNLMTCLCKRPFLANLRKTDHAILDLAAGKIFHVAPIGLTRRLSFAHHTNPIRWAIHDNQPYYVMIASINAREYELFAGYCPGMSRKDLVPSLPLLQISPARDKALYLSKGTDLPPLGGGQLAYFDTEALQTTVLTALDEEESVTDFCWWSDKTILYVVRCGSEPSEVRWDVRTASVEEGATQTLFTTESEIVSLGGCAEKRSLLYVAAGALHSAHPGENKEWEHIVLSL